MYATRLMTEKKNKLSMPGKRSPCRLLGVVANVELPPKLVLPLRLPTCFPSALEVTCLQELATLLLVEQVNDILGNAGEAGVEFVHYIAIRPWIWHVGHSWADIHDIVDHEVA